MEMIKILLVDDEEWIRTSLKNKIEWSDELILCAEASDGYEALELAVNLRPDIVITDVRMPGMSGIEMLRIMREFLPDLQSIFISGYNEFDYVKSAMELESSGYVLKPIHQNELEETLNRTLEKIRQNNLLHHTMQTQMELLHKFLEGFLNQLPPSEHKFASLLKDLHFHSDYLYVLLVRFFDNMEEPISLEQKLNSILASLSYSYTCTVFPVSKTVYGIFLSSEKNVDLLSYARNVIRSLQRKVSLDASISLGLPCRKILELSESFQSAKDGLKWMHLYRSHEIILPKHSPSEERSFSIPKELQRRIWDGIYSHNLSALTETLEELSSFLKEQETLTVFELGSVLHLLLGNILQLLYEQNVSREFIDRGISLMQIFSSYQPQEDILRKFCSYCKEAASLFGSTASIESTIQKAQKYMQEHYSQELSLKQMASLYYLNPSYFSVSFKNIVGKNFNEYLTELRIEHAKNYLEENQYKINQVSRLVGYEDYSYFGKLFRKATGLTPKEYQKQFLDQQPDP